MNDANGANGSNGSNGSNGATRSASRAAVASRPRRAIASGPIAPEAAPDVHEIAGEADEGALIAADAQPRTPFVERLRRITAETWLWVAVIGLGAILRFWELGAKPLHHDESMHAYFSLAFARDPSSYSYDPLLHGPFQFHAEGLFFAIIMGLEAIFRVSSPGNDPWINDTTARIVPALFGLGIVALPYGLRSVLGRVGAWGAALLLAVSPAFVYFSRFLREDIYFNFFMFAMVVCAVQFARKRTITWFALTVAATVLAYATFEGIYLTFAIFGAFLGALLVWEVGAIIARLLPEPLTLRERKMFARAGLLILYAGIGAIIAYIALKIVDNLNAYILAHQQISDLRVAQLEDTTVRVLLYFSIGVAILVIFALLWQITRDSALEAAQERENQRMSEAYENGDDFELEEPAPASWELRADRIFSAPGRWIGSLHDRLDPDEQPFLRLLLSGTWVRWFVGFVVAWVVFAAMYWEIPFSLVHAFSPNAPTPADPTIADRTLSSGFSEGIGRGIWQGLYYWIQQQQVARGAQPIYYYFFIIPLYEQVGIALGLAGLVYALARPTRFRLFLVWWFIASLAIYSWAGEKMPWLTIHILLPLMLLGGLFIGWAVRQMVALWQAACDNAATLTQRIQVAARGLNGWRPAGALASLVIGFLLLIPTVHGMAELAFVDPAEGPLEPYVYVQTTPDVDLIMNKINYADQVLYHGKHQLTIDVGAGEEWPFYWYLRDYYLDPHPSTYVTWSVQTFSANGPKPDVLILLPGAEVQSFLSAHPTGYRMKQYRLRAWFDESYKPQQCNPTP
ncbi:MAG TPA: glycosyltransferase family 39 protein, partial [Ktedonobacterales bacterium]|nr:glycosyltransferase family 39 protein [Ktedonobacterales bacterium]